VLTTERDRIGLEIEKLVRSYHNDCGALIAILQEVQRRYRHVSQYAMQVIADALDVHPAQVFSVVSYYRFLSTTPRGRFVIQLSDCIAHDAVERAAVARQLEKDLGIRFGETTVDGLFSLEHTGCIGMCDQGPVVSVNGRIHTQFTADRVGALLRDCLGGGDMVAAPGRD